jgi:peptide/nickel transport system permease protein
LIQYILRRVGALLLVLLGSTFLIYNLTAISGDPLEDLRLSTEPNAQFLLEKAIQDLQLDVPPPVRYFNWLLGILGLSGGTPTFGLTLEGSAVIDIIGLAIPITIRLVIISTILSIVVGISIGIISALRQYSRFDYTITFIAFLFFSLPIFWVAVLLKQFAAIEFNNFLYDPVISTNWMVGLAFVGAFIFAGVVGGNRKRFFITLAGAFALNFATLAYISATGWLLTPSLGPVLITVFAFGIAFGITQLSTGISNRRVLFISLGLAALTPIFYFIMQPVFNESFQGSMMWLLAAATVAVGYLVGFVFGGDDRGPAARTGMIVAFLSAGLIVLDRFMQSWDEYYNNEWIFGRPIATVGDSIPEIGGDYWMMGVDGFTHLLLPTAALMLISVAGYVRYSRASLLEVLNQDYIRTARAKGLTERTVIMRHAFRNALIPLTTIMAFDFAGILGGAIITEQVFAWRGMGTLFNTGLAKFDLNLVMAVVLITSVSALLFNLIADLVYSALDPRIRVTK